MKKPLIELRHAPKQKIGNARLAQKFRNFADTGRSSRGIWRNMCSTAAESNRKFELCTRLVTTMPSKERRAQPSSLRQKRQDRRGDQCMNCRHSFAGACEFCVETCSTHCTFLPAHFCNCWKALTWWR